MATFHPFPRLPPELRQQIWDLSMTARTIAAPPPAGAARSPAAMRACREARTRYAQVYTLAVLLDAARPVWVHFGRDTVAAAHYGVQGMPGATLRAVRRLRLAVDADEFELFRSLTSAYLRPACMPALETATIVVGPAADGSRPPAWDTDVAAWPHMNKRVRFDVEFTGPKDEA